MTEPTMSGTTAGDTDTSESLTQSCEYLLDEKALKKKLKKERQKKKKIEIKVIKSNSEPPSVLVEDVKDQIVEIKLDKDHNKDINNIIEHENNSDTENLTDNEDLDMNFSTAFIQSIINQKDNNKKYKKHDFVKNKQDSMFKDPNYEPHKIFTDNADGFTAVKKGTKQAPSTLFKKTPDGFGNEAIRVIREGNFQLAINYLNRGIQLDSSDTRHYINRSYCYLRVGEYDHALADSQYASTHLNDILEMSRAKCREGQALCGLQDYPAAEAAFRESINLVPDFMYAKRELIRVQVRQMVEMGFKERDALMALEKKPNTRDVIDLLSEQSLTQTNSYDSSGNQSNDEDNDDDEIFHSDTEEDPSNERLLSKLLKYNPNLPECTYVAEPVISPPPLMKDLIQISNLLPRATSQERTLRVIKAVPVVAKANKINPGINEKAVWVGCIPDQITDAMVQKRFTRFGKVTAVRRLPSNDALKSYAFVNFSCQTAAEKALEEASYNNGCLELNGVRLTIKRATLKTFKY